jgi:glycosyltransferase involved in cell wall biosynthesis
MRIVHVGKFYPPALGGIETHVQILAEGQVRRGHHVAVVCMQHTTEPTASETRAGVAVHRLHRRISFAKLDWLPDFAATLRRSNPDIIHVHVPNPSAILGLLRVRPEAPMIVTYHSDNVAQKLRSRVFRLAELPFYRRVDKILATSPAYVRGSNMLTRHRDKTLVVPLGIDTAQFTDPPARVHEHAARLRAEHGAPLWFACGRLVPYKGFDVALEALASAPGTLLLAGEGPLRRRLELDAQRHGVANRVRFLGRVDDATRNACLHACDAFWFPSVTRNEAFGLAQLEAMASGTPVLNCDIAGSGVSWVSEHSVSGLTVPVYDAEAMARAARQLADDKDLRTRLAEGARRRALTLFDHERVIESVTSAYERVVDDSPRLTGRWRS